MTNSAEFRIEQHSRAPLRMEFNASFNAPPDALFKIISDHHAVANWVPLMKAVSMEHRKTGNSGECGVGSVRHCTLRGMGGLDETIVWWSPPYGYAFKVAAKSKMMMPTVDHVSVMLIAPTTDGGSVLTWRHYFNWRGLVMRHMTAIMLPMMMKTAMSNIRKELGGSCHDTHQSSQHCCATQGKKSCCK